MYFLLILFFGSLLSITFMIGRKLVVLKNGQTTLNEEEIISGVPFFEEWKHSAAKNIKKHSYNGLVAIIRLYFRSANFLKSKYQDLKIKVKNLRGKKLNAEEKREVSGFLKMISEYKQKIREIKHKIKEEENL